MKLSLVGVGIVVALIAASKGPLPEVPKRPKHRERLEEGDV